MKNIYKNDLIKKTAATLAFAFGVFTVNAQTAVIDFETFTLSPNSAYSPSATVPFQTPEAIFKYKYSSGYWSNGFAYTNITNSTTPGYANQFGVRAYTGYTNSATYAVCWSAGTILLPASQSTVNGFYITNTTYAYFSILNGDQFTRKFGDTTGTGSGTMIPQGSYPDFFKVIIRGYKNGTIKADSSTVMLADYTFTNNAQDFVLDSWRFVNTSNLGEVDSLKFSFRSSDVGSFGINTPTYFAMDNFSVSRPATGLAENSLIKNLSVYPNPFTSALTIKLPLLSETKTSFRVFDITGKQVIDKTIENEETTIDLNTLDNGVYFIEVISGDQKAVAKIVKN